MSIIKILAPRWNVGRDPQCIDNSRLKEQARQQRRELARLQLPPEKQPTKNLFGPPIPVSRPNDPTFKHLSNFFGSPVGADISLFRSSSNNDASPTDESHNRNHRLADTRHGDARRTDYRQNDSRHGDTRQGDARHDDTRHRDNRTIHTNEFVAKNSRPGHAGASTSSLELGAEQARQGVFEQFVKSSTSKTPTKVNSDRTPTIAKTDSTSGSRQSMTDGKMKNKTVALERSRTDSFKDSKLEESSVFSHNIGSTNSKSKLTAHQSKFSSSPAPNPSLTPTASSLPSNKMHDRNEHKASPWNIQTGKDHERNPAVRLNGTIQDVDTVSKNSEVEKKLMLCIPKEYEKCDDFVTKVIQEVSIPSPLTGILTPKKADIPFPFPDTVGLGNHIETIPKDEDDGDEEAIDRVERAPVQHLFDSTGKTIPNQSSKDVLEDLNLSESSDSENEQVEEHNLHQRTPDGADRRNMADQKSSGSLPLVEDLSESSEASSSEESCSSGSESDSSQSDNEEMKNIGIEKDESDETEDKQSKRPSWDLSNFVPKSNEHVPLCLLPSSPSSPPANINRQTSHDDFDTDINDPIKQIYMMSPHQVLSPLPIPTSDVEHLESDHSMDIVHLLSPKIPQSPSSMVNGRSLGIPRLDLSGIDFASPEQDRKSYMHSPSNGTSFSTPILGVDYFTGKPSVVVRIRRSYLFKKVKTAKYIDDVSNGTSRIAGNPQVSTSFVSTKSAVQTDYRSPVLGGCDQSSTNYSPPGSVTKFSESATASNSSSLQRSSSGHSKHTDSSTTRMLSTTLKPTSARPSPVESVSANNKQQRIENSPAKISRDKTDDTYLLASKAVKRKSEDVGPLDQKKLCDRNSVNRKEDRKSQSRLQVGNPESSQKPRVVTPELRNQLKSPLTTGEDNNSRSSSSSLSNIQRQIEKTKFQNGHTRDDEKTRKTSSSKLNGKGSEHLNSISSSSVKIETPVVNGIGGSPAHTNVCDVVLPGDLCGNRNQTADQEQIDRLHQQDPPNGIKRVKYEPERLDSSDYYIQQARKLKHEGDSGPDKFSKVLSYTESVLAFVCHCSALELEHAESSRILKMYQDTLALCQYSVRVMESVVIPEKYHLLVLSLRIQSIISLRLYNIRKADVAKLKSVLDEHNKNHMSKPLQIPSPYQTNHHHSTNTTTGSWNHANGTPSPRSPRPSPSPAGSIGSVGSAGSSNGDSGMAKPMSFVNGHSLTSIVVPQRIHSVMMNFLSYMNYLHQCHDYWDQADSFLTAHPTVGDVFHSVNTEFGPIDLHSSTLAIVRYASEVIKHVRTETKRLSQVVRTD